MSVFETERLNGSDDFYAIQSIPLGAGREAQRTRRNSLIVALGLSAVSCVSLVLAIVATVHVSQLRKDVAAQATAGTQQAGAAQAGPQFQPTRRIAFGSCSAYDLRPQSLWTDGVVPVQPDAWIWLGDMAYLDTSPVSCSVPELQSLPALCNCTPGFMSLPGQCLAGNVDAARDRWQHAVSEPNYAAFLDYMCPPGLAGAAAAASASGQSGVGSLPGRFPPAGTDPRVCPRPIFGVYDDHDYGWNNGNRRLPNKAEFKRMFLDAVGEAPGSSRRSADAGLQAVYRLNGGGPGRDVDLVLLDERWYRDPLPCELRREWCEGLLANPDRQPAMVGWCRDFLVDDGTTGRGSCCTKDGDLAAWCALPGSRSSPLWTSACDPTSSQWGARAVVLDPDNATLLPVTEELWEEQQGPLWARLLQAHDSPVCEILGSSQRRWLQRHLASSTAALTLVASGSVPLGSMGWSDAEGSCSGDDWNCWRPAQLNLLHTLANTSSGCVVVLTGDFHYGDIKSVQPGATAPYAGLLKVESMKKPIYQLMASGMTDSTAHHDGLPCNGTYREDLVGLRPMGPCSITTTPNFGLVEIDWEGQMVHLTVRDADGGGIATSGDGSTQHLAFSLKTCQRVPV